MAEGFGTSDELARKDALKSACERVAEYLDKEHNEKNYKPEPQFLQNLNVLPPTDEVKVTSGTVPNMPEMKAATVQIRVTSDSVRRMCEQARQQRAEQQELARQQRVEQRQQLVEQRQHWLGLGLASFVALLLVGAGYLRLEEATKGYYTGLLRVAALAFLGMVAGGIWYIMG